MTSLFDHALEDVQQEGMGLASLASNLEPMLAKFKEDFSTMSESVLKRMKNQVGRGNVVKRNPPKAKTISRKTQSGAGKTKAKATKTKKQQTGRGRKVVTTSKKKPSSKKSKLQTNF